MPVQILRALSTLIFLSCISFHALAEYQLTDLDFELEYTKQNRSNLGLRGTTASTVTLRKIDGVFDCNPKRCYWYFPSSTSTLVSFSFEFKELNNQPHKKTFELKNFELNHQSWADQWTFEKLRVISAFTKPTQDGEQLIKASYNTEQRVNSSISYSGKYPIFHQLNTIILSNQYHYAMLMSPDHNATPKEYSWDAAMRSLVITFPRPSELNPLNMNTTLFFPPVRLELGEGNEFEGLRTYYNEQKNSADSFFSKVQKSPGLSLDTKFVLAVGAVRSSQRTQRTYDITQRYMQFIRRLNNLHGKDFVLYHIGWSDEEGIPGDPGRYLETLKPGHQSLLQQLPIQQVAYTWPGVINLESEINSSFIQSHDIRLKKDGTQDTFMEKGELIANINWYRSSFASQLLPIYYDVLHDLGFDGFYLDALDTAGVSYQQNVPAGQNLQGLGISNFIKKTEQLVNNPELVFATEVPNEAVHQTGITGLDHVGENPFASIYPGMTQIEANTLVPEAPGAEETKATVNKALSMLFEEITAGVTPLILYPEFDGVLPADPFTDPVYGIFFQALQKITQSWSILKPIREGVALGKLQNFPLNSSTTHQVSGKDLNSPERRITVACWHSVDSAQQNIPVSLDLILSKNDLRLSQSDRNRKYKFTVLDENAGEVSSGVFPKNPEMGVDIQLTCPANGFVQILAEPDDINRKSLKN